ncbi:cupin domain-containing protein [Catenovulum sediminis]|uniref:Cupin domain-containing protein n=1 Tax=Catenovulum sediminis TaxID=1740262 RepID=A0ABV1REF1_9ALTE|nr:cupin domain-containing protein [Catenovulum sediminis]
MSESKCFVYADEVPVEDLGGGITRQILGYNDSLMVVKVWFKKGAEGYVHSHHHSQVTYVESGEFDVNVGGEIKRLKAGDSFYIPPHVEHGAVCQSEGVLLDTFSPVREDFLGA